MGNDFADACMARVVSLNDGHARVLSTVPLQDSDAKQDSVDVSSVLGI